MVTSCTRSGGRLGAARVCVSAELSSSLLAGVVELAFIGCDGAGPDDAALREFSRSAIFSAPDGILAEIRFYNVAAEHFEIFKKDLASEANIEAEPKNTAKELEAARQADRQLLVKVTILPAETSSNSR